MKKLTILSSLLLLALNSCSNEEIFNEEMIPGYEKRITVVAEDLTSADGTRTSYTDNGNGYRFAWTEGDALGIFPQNGRQTEFPVGEDGVGSNTAVFDGGDWALKPNAKYAAYYPLVEDFKLDPTAIPIVYTGQVQDGNGSTAHLSKYDYMASSFTEVDDKGNVNFQLQHLGCLVQFKLTMPEADTYSSLEIVSSGTPFITSGTYSLADADHTITNAKTSNIVTIGLNNVSTTAENKTLTITAMFAPVDLSSSTLNLTVKGFSKDYTFEIKGQDLPKSKAVNNSSEIVDDTPYVTFHSDSEQTLTMSKEVPTIEYSVNGGKWMSLGTETVTFGGSNGNLMLRGKSSYGTATNNSDYSRIVFGSNAIGVRCSGDIRTLVDYENYSSANTANARFCSLFYLCKSLTTAPKLPATTLADYCYYNMFASCNSLTSAPEELPAKKLATACYGAMFSNCYKLKTMPQLPATSLSTYCYANMFAYCKALTTAELPATSLPAFCYFNMFAECTNLSSIKVAFNKWNDIGDATTNWLKGVAESGTFICPSALPVTYGYDNIPSGWTVSTATK